MLPKIWFIFSPVVGNNGLWIDLDLCFEYFFKWAKVFFLVIQYWVTATFSSSGNWILVAPHFLYT